MARTISSTGHKPSSFAITNTSIYFNCRRFNEASAASMMNLREQPPAKPMEGPTCQNIFVATMYVERLHAFFYMCGGGREIRRWIMWALHRKSKSSSSSKFYLENIAKHNFTLSICKSVTSIKIIDAIFIGYGKYLFGGLFTDPGAKWTPTTEAKAWDSKAIFT